MRKTFPASQRGRADESSNGAENAEDRREAPNDPIDLALASAARATQAELARSADTESRTAQLLWQRFAAEPGTRLDAEGRARPRAEVREETVGSRRIDAMVRSVRRAQWVLTGLACVAVALWAAGGSGAAALETVSRALVSRQTALLPTAPLELLTVAVVAAVGLALFAYAQSLRET